MKRKVLCLILAAALSLGLCSGTGQYRQTVSLTDAGTGVCVSGQNGMAETQTQIAMALDSPETFSGENMTSGGRAGQTATVLDNLKTMLAKNLAGTVRPARAAAATPVQQHGALHVSGTDLKDSHGAKVQLKGVSTHGIAWFPQYVNKAAFQTLRDRYGINTIRLAMYPTAAEGYGASTVKKVQEGVRYATQLGMYVIIDWHILSDGNPKHAQKAAAKFFRKMARKYKNNKNVIYEICNEPNGNVTWTKQIKPYASRMIRVIRKYSKRSIIVVGTPTWSQDVDIAAQSPLKAKNIMYALHFYAATHGDWLRQKLKTAHQKGLPVIVTEFSICDASGNGVLDRASGNQWMRLLNQYGISYAAWSLCNKNESASLIASSCGRTSGWGWGDLSAAGKWYFRKTSA